MIRKRAGDAFWLIGQRDHAALAATLASAFGNRQFARPSSPAVTRAVAIHDDGWAAPDAAPEPDSAGLPPSVFHTPRRIEHAAWLASAVAAEAAGPYEGLLVALHGLSLSALSAGQMPAERFDDEQRRRQFDLNKIQHALIEQVERLRGVLGLPTDRPLRLGLADGWTTPADEALRFDLRVLQTCDALSLHACCDTVPASLVPQPLARPGGGAVPLSVDHRPGAIHVTPWPFADAAIEATVLYRPVQALAYADADALTAALQAAPVRSLPITFRRG